MKKQICALSTSIAAAFCIVASVYLSACAGGNFEVESDIPNAMPHGTSINGNENKKSRLIDPTRRAKPGEEYSSQNGVSNFPAFPKDIGPARYAARADYPIVLSGSGEWDDSSAVHKGLISYAPEGVSFDGNTINLDSAVADIICWAQYQIGDLTGDTIGELTIEGGTVPDGGAYDLFIANWSDQVWDIYRFTENDFGGASIDLSSHSNEYVSQSGLFVWIFVVLDGVSGFVNEWTLTGEGQLGIPQDVSASDGTYSDKIKVTWSAVEYAEQYHIYRDMAQDGDFTAEIAGSPVSGTEIDDTSIQDEEMYWYKVKAANANGESALSDPDSGYVLSTGWHLLTIETNIGAASLSLKTVNGFPAIAFRRNGTLAYVRASDERGVAWDSPIVVDSGSNTGYDISLSIINDYPAISYSSFATNKLKYVIASDSNGEEWQTPIVIDNISNASWYNGWLPESSLALVNGNPAISYRGSSRYLRFVRANDTLGTSWGTPLTLDNSGIDSGVNSSLVVVNGNPAIGYHHGSGQQTKYLRATNASGTAWGSPLIVHTHWPGAWPSMAIVDGVPAFSFYAEAAPSYGPRFVRAINVDGSSWGAPVVIDSTGVGICTSLAVVNGMPAVAYFNYQTHRLRFVRASNSQGTAWNIAETIDSGANVGQRACLAEIAGQPAIAYQDGGAGALKYAYYVESS